MRRVHRFSPDEANESPAGQHQDTSQGQSKEAAWGLRTCGGSWADMSPDSHNWTRNTAPSLSSCMYSSVLL